VSGTILETTSPCGVRIPVASNVSSLVVDERQVYWIEAGMLRRREKG
jgi:hypothetical protein